MRELNFGVLVPTNPLFQERAHVFYPFEWATFLGEKRSHPIPFHGVELKLTSDIAICKVPPRPGGAPHQPLTMIQPSIRGTSLVPGAQVGAIGYPGMLDIDHLVINDDNQIVGRSNFDLHASTGKILDWLPDNLQTKTASTPGPCFSFEAKIPGGMSGGPIFDREGVYVHGVVSKGLDGAAGPEKLGFGSMLGPSLSLPIARMKGASLLQLQAQGNEGMAKIGSAPGM